MRERQARHPVGKPAREGRHAPVDMAQRHFCELCQQMVGQAGPWCQIYCYPSAICRANREAGPLKHYHVTVLTERDSIYCVLCKADVGVFDG